MKFLYLTNSRLPGEKAHAIQIMKTCATLAAYADVRIIHAQRTNRPWLSSVTNLQAYYDLPRDVPRQAIRSLDLFYIVPGMPPRWLQGRILLRSARVSLVVASPSLCARKDSNPVVDHDSAFSRAHG